MSLYCVFIISIKYKYFLFFIFSSKVIVTNQITTRIGAQRISPQNPAVDGGSAGTVGKDVVSNLF